jgi:hypothetical protein
MWGLSLLLGKEGIHLSYRKTTGVRAKEHVFKKVFITKDPRESFPSNFYTEKVALDIPNDVVAARLEEDLSNLPQEMRPSFEFALETGRLRSADFKPNGTPFAAADKNANYLRVSRERYQAAVGKEYPNLQLGEISGAEGGKGGASVPEEESDGNASSQSSTDSGSDESSDENSQSSKSESDTENVSILLLIVFWVL